MSTGERSCLHYGECQMLNHIPNHPCNVDCHGYSSNGSKPDTKHFQSAIAPRNLFPKKKKMKIKRRFS